MKKDHLFLVFIGIVIAMFVWTCIMTSNYVSLTIKYEKAVNYIQALETDFPDYIDITAENDAYYEYYN